MGELINILNEIKPGVDFTSSSNIIEDHLLTSMEIVILVSKLSEEFDIEISVADLRPENFKTLDDIVNLVNRLKEE